MMGCDGVSQVCRAQDVPDTHHHESDNRWATLRFCPTYRNLRFGCYALPKLYFTRRCPPALKTAVTGHPDSEAIAAVMQIIADHPIQHADSPLHPLRGPFGQPWLLVGHDPVLSLESTTLVSGVCRENLWFGRVPHSPSTVCRAVPCR